MTLFISPHTSAHVWARRYFPCAAYFAQISRRQLLRLPPTEIYGQLAVPLAAIATEAGHRYYHLQLPGISELRSPSAEDLQSLRPRFTLYRIEEHDTIFASELRSMKASLLA